MDTSSTSTLIGGALAIAGAVVSIYFTEWVKGRRLEKNLAWALHSEISSICAILRKRNYVSEFRSLAQDAQAGIENSRRNVKAAREYFLIYKSNASQIGLLKQPLPSRIVAFYVQGTAILEDIDALSSGFHDDKKLAELAEYFEELANLIYDLLRQGDELTQTISSEYS
jgi:hypothetical protein